MSRLFILGNGFDLSHGLKTHEDAYIKYLDLNKNNFLFWHKALLDSLKYTYSRKWRVGIFHTIPQINLSEITTIQKMVNELKRQENREIEWSGLEGSIECDFFPLPSMPKDIIEKIIIEKRKSFISWLQNLPTPLEIRHFRSDDYFLTFNYTMILERVYKIENDKIFHIHGISSDIDTIQFGNDQINLQHLSQDLPLFPIYLKNTNDNNEKLKKFINNIPHLTEIHIFGWRGQTNSPLGPWGGYGVGGSDVTLSSTLLTNYIQTEKPIYIYHFPNISESNSGLKIFRRSNIKHIPYKKFTE